MKRMRGNTSVIKKITYSVSANLVSLSVSFLVSIIVPKYFSHDIESYGYYQIFVFYAGYIGILHFGLCDGILLRDAGREYSSLDKRIYSGEFRILLLFEALVSVAAFLIGVLLTDGTNYTFIWVWIAVNIIFVVPKYMLSYILQATGRVMEYSILTAAGRGLFGAIIILNIRMQLSGFRWLVLAQTAGEFLSLILAVWYCRGLVFARPYSYKRSLSECRLHIEAGCKLLFANIAGLLITGVVRFGIQAGFDVADYGKISFSLTASNMFLTFISAIELVLYPVLKKIEPEKLLDIYSKLYAIVMLMLFGAMFFYYPIELLLSAWIPEYGDALKYMAVLFPVCVYSSKMNLLIQNYMKVFRMERQIMQANMAAMFLSVVTAVVSVGILHSLTAAMAAIVINHMARCMIAECMLCRKMAINAMEHSVLEGVLTAVFIFAMWIAGGWAGTVIYGGCYFLWLGIFTAKKIHTL